MQGRRPDQEDTVSVARGISGGEWKDELYVGVFDGHMGPVASARCAKRLHVHIGATLKLTRADGGLSLDAGYRCFLSLSLSL
jgi:serine/threonine protein phosphatase PrpC